MKTLWILRGIPGAGKTVVADKLSAAFECLSIGRNTEVFSLETYLEAVEGGELMFKQWAQEMEEDLLASMAEGLQNIILHDVYAQPWQWRNAKQAALDYGYQVHFLIVENRHEGESIHGVPDQQMAKYTNTFDIHLAARP